MVRTLVFLGTLILGCGAEEAPEPQLLESHYDDGAPMWVGTVSREHLKQPPFSRWFDSRYQSYTPKAEVVEALSQTLEAVELEVYLGTWCSDSTREVPRLNRVLDETGFSLVGLEMIALSDHPGEFKQSPEGKEKERLIHRTPTIVVSRDGKEIGRIVQNARKSLEEDLLAILEGEEYVPRFEAESKLHEIVSHDGIDGLEDRKDELRRLGDANSLWHYAQYDLMFNDRHREAVAVLDLFLELYPDSGRGYLLRAKAHEKLGDEEQALADVRQSLEHAPGNQEAQSLERKLSN